MLNIVNRYLELELIQIDQWVSKSGNGLHVILKSNTPLVGLERIVLALLLGSDPMHEMFNYRESVTPGYLNKPAKKTALDTDLDMAEF